MAHSRHSRNGGSLPFEPFSASQMEVPALNFHQEEQVPIAMKMPGCYGALSPPDVLVIKDSISFVEVSGPELLEGNCYTLLW